MLTLGITQKEKCQGGLRAQLLSSRNLPWQFLCSQPLLFYSGTCWILTSTSEARRGKYQQQAPGRRQAERSGLERQLTLQQAEQWVINCPTLSYKPVSSSSPGLSLLPVTYWLLPNPTVTIVSHISHCRSLLGAIPELGYAQGCSSALRNLSDLPHFVSEAYRFILESWAKNPTGWFSIGFKEKNCKTSKTSLPLTYLTWQAGLGCPLHTITLRWCWELESEWPRNWLGYLAIYPESM